MGHGHPEVRDVLREKFQIERRAVEGDQALRASQKLPPGFIARARQMANVPIAPGNTDQRDAVVVEAESSGLDVQENGFRRNVAAIL